MSKKLPQYPFHFTFFKGLYTVNFYITSFQVLASVPKQIFIKDKDTQEQQYLQSFWDASCND